VGASIGSLLSLWGAGLVRSFLWGVEEHDPGTLAVAVLCCIGVSAIASLVPALGIFRLDPVQTLRE